jgi:hypothetical protein
VIFKGCVKGQQESVQMASSESLPSGIPRGACPPTEPWQLAILELEIGEICGIVLLAVCIAALLIRYRYCRNTRSTLLTPAAVEGVTLSKAPVLDGI